MPETARLPVRIAALTLLAGLSLASCREPQREGNTGDYATNEASEATLPKAPLAGPQVDREGLLIAIARAASALATGQDDSAAQAALDGDTFEFKIRFGCADSEELRLEEAPSARFDEEKRTMRLRALPTISKPHPLVETVAGEQYEAVEGFWVRRPWLLTPACPLPPVELADLSEADTSPKKAKAPEKASPREASAAGGDTTATVAVLPLIGLAQFFDSEDSRTHRRNRRAYEAVVTLDENRQPSPKGYNLVLSGRLQRLGSGKVIACVSERPEAPPSCIVSVRFGRVWFERADTGEVVAEWGAG